MSSLLHHVTLEVAPAEVKACHAFYCDVLGLHEIESPIKQTMWFAEGVHMYWGSDKRPHRGEVSARHFALVVGYHYSSIVYICQRRQLFLQHATAYWGSPRCYVCDPARNRIELIERAPTRVLHD